MAPEAQRRLPKGGAHQTADAPGIVPAAERRRPRSVLRRAAAATQARAAELTKQADENALDARRARDEPDPRGALPADAVHVPTVPCCGMVSQLVVLTLTP